MASSEKKSSSPGSSTFGAGTEHFEKKNGSVAGYATDAEVVPRSKLNALFENPLEGIPREQLFMEVDEFCNKFDLTDHREVFRKGALVAQMPHRAQDLDYLTEQDKAVLLREHTHKWDQPKTLYYLVSKYNCFYYQRRTARLSGPLVENVGCFQ